MKLTTNPRLYLSTAVLALLLSNGATAAQFECGNTGGELVFAQNAQVNGLDQHFSSSISTRNVATHLYETLMTRGETNDVVPMLAESYAVSDDGLSYTFKLRRGITFHNGKEMTSADVLASHQRYVKISPDRGTFKHLDSFSAPDDYTFIIKLKQPIPVFPEEYSSFRVPISIHPADQGDAEPGKIEFIGTGPYQLIEWVPDSHVTMKRFDDYQPRTDFDDRTGFGGYKVACFDTVTFRIVKEPGARVAGLETGELDAADDIPVKAAKRMEDNQDIQFLTLENWWVHVAMINVNRPPTDNLKIRRAIQVALDMEEIMEIATDGAYSLQPGYQYPGNPYYTNAGGEHYNVSDIEQAKQLIAEAGYQSEEIVLNTNSDYTNMYNASLVMSEQLKAVGLNVRMEVSDWPTSIQKRKDPALWNFFFTGFGTGPSIGPRAALKGLVPPSNSPGIKEEDDPEWMSAWEQMHQATTHEGRLEGFARMQKRLYEQVYALKFGDYHKIQAARANVHNFKPHRVPRFWNVWKD